MPNFPTIMLEVLSLDSWNRFRTEGYTYLTIPGQPGNYLLLVNLRSRSEPTNQRLYFDPSF